MSKNSFKDHDIYGLRPGYNTRRGEVLDGVRVSLTKCGPRWWIVGGPHGVQDGSVHHQFMCFFQKQPGRQATCASIRANFPNLPKEFTAYLRELVKQEIVEMKH